MKKSIICGAASLAFAATSVVSAFAVGPGTQTNDVTVGEVDETIYSVDISWGDMAFDWKYNEETNEHNFELPKECIELTYDGYGALFNGKVENQKMFNDNTCSSLVSNPVEGNQYFAERHINDRIVVSDNSENGHILAQASFASEPDYEWVTGTIINYPVVWEDYIEELEDGMLPCWIDTEFGESTCVGYLKLEKNNLYTTSSNINAGDKIGTITLTISPDTNVYPELQ